MPVTELLLVDDHPLYREGVIAVLESRLPGVRVHCAADARSGLDVLRAHPDIEAVLLDWHLPDADGFSALASYAQAFPQVARLLISGQDINPQLPQRALAAGAAGFIPKTLSAALMVEAIRCVLEGGVYLPEGTADALPSTTDSGLEALSLRQHEVLQLMLRGQPNKQIARELGIAERTVKAHLTRVFEALGVATRTQAVIAAQRLGLHAAPARPA